MPTLKKLAVPFFTLALTFGCSSSTTPTTGTGGSSATGGSGGAKATGGSGGAKATGGAGGSSATGGAGGSTTTTDAGRMADCTVVDPGGTGTDTLTPAVFCANFFAYCSNISGLTPPANEQACEDLYSHSGQEHCRSYHMCWGVEGITNTSANPMVHCFHTLGMNGVCTATTDAATGN